MNITMIKQEYSLTDSGKGFKSKPDTVKETTITEAQYSNIISATPFFRKLGGVESMERNYTSAGYRVVKLSSTSPDRDRKVVRLFEFNY